MYVMATVNSEKQYKPVMSFNIRAVATLSGLIVVAVSMAFYRSHTPFTPRSLPLLIETVRSFETDFNNDGYPDLIIQRGDRIQTYLGNSNGEYVPITIEEKQINILEERLKENL